ncbi:MAG: GNAT family N-acetyltransferase [Actinomycetota bacterium]
MIRGRVETPDPKMIQEGRSVYLRRLSEADAPALLAVRLANRGFLEPYEPQRSEDFYTLRSQKEQIKVGELQWRSDQRYAFGVFDLMSDRLVGNVALSNIVRGAWQNATLGYFIAQERGGRGLGTEAVGLIVDFGFDTASLHRVQAGVMPRNRASVRILEKNGFRHEGFSPRYLNINGVWQDHEMYAITAEEWSP